MKSTGYSKYFYVYLKQIDVALSGLQEQATRGINTNIHIWKSTWMNAYDGRVGVQQADLLRFGTLLGRLAETYSFHLVAEEVFDRLAESAENRESWISNPASVLITAGEYSRRRGNLQHAEIRYNHALKILEDGLIATADRQPTHGGLGRVFYELAYIHRLRGDNGAARSTLECSEAECDLAKDEVGGEIARTLLAVISYEEGFADRAVCELSDRVSRLERLADDPLIKDAGRSSFARRWLVNAQIHLAQAYLAVGNSGAARRLIGGSQAGPSITGLATTKRIEAQVLLAEGHLSAARDVIGDSWKLIEQQAGDLISTELSAATVSIAGVIHALEESEHSRKSALSCFEQACKLPPDLHNRKAQGWAWAGRAILAREARERLVTT